MCDRQSDVRISLPATPSSVAEVRRVARVVTGHDHVGEEQREVLVLLASEAASNVLRHTGSPLLDLNVACDVRTVAVGVGGQAPRLVVPSPEEVDGVGLRMIDRQSLRWGLSPTVGGWELWFVAPTHEDDLALKTRPAHQRLADAP